jgi:hypothetical protein
MRLPHFMRPTFHPQPVWMLHMYVVVVVVVAVVVVVLVVVVGSCRLVKELCCLIGCLPTCGFVSFLACARPASCSLQERLFANRRIIWGLDVVVQVQTSCLWIVVGLFHLSLLTWFRFLVCFVWLEMLLVSVEPRSCGCSCSCSCSW